MTVPDPSAINIRIDNEDIEITLTEESGADSVSRLNLMNMPDRFGNAPGIPSGFNNFGRFLSFEDCSSPGAFEGVQMISLQPLSSRTAVTKCDAEGWTVIQSRGQFGNHAGYFFRLWRDYEEEFGHPRKTSDFMQIIAVNYCMCLHRKRILVRTQEFKRPNLEKAIPIESSPFR